MLLFVQYQLVWWSRSPLLLSGFLHWPSECDHLEWVEFPTLSDSFFLSSGLGNVWPWRRRFLGICVRDDRFRCRLFLWVQASISGSPAGSWVVCCVLCVTCLGVLQGSCLARWVRSTVGFSISGENNVDTGVPHRFECWMSC